MNTIHELKTWIEPFQDVWDGRKTFEVRENDRDFKTGDFILLKEGQLGGFGMTDHDLTFVYTGREIGASITYIMQGGKFGIEEGYVVMGIDIIEKQNK